MLTWLLLLLAVLVGVPSAAGPPADGVSPGVEVIEGVDPKDASVLVTRQLEDRARDVASRHPDLFAGGIHQPGGIALQTTDPDAARAVLTEELGPDVASVVDLYVVGLSLDDVDRARADLFPLLEQGILNSLGHGGPEGQVSLTWTEESSRELGGEEALRERIHELAPYLEDDDVAIEVGPTATVEPLPES